MSNVKQIKNINRDYLVKLDIKSSSIFGDTLKFYITDDKTSNIFVQLLINMSDNPIINKFVILENASDYKMTLNIVKPNNEPKSIEGRLLNEEEAIFLFDLKNDCKDILGDYLCELYVTCNVNEHEEASTSDSFKYKVEKSILNNLDETIKKDADFPIVKKLLERINQSNDADLWDLRDVKSVINIASQKMGFAEKINTNMIQGKIINNATDDNYGLVDSNVDGYLVTDFIPVNATDHYTITNSECFVMCVGYNSNKEPLRTYYPSNKIWGTSQNPEIKQYYWTIENIPPDVSYIKICFNLFFTDSITINKDIR